MTEGADRGNRRLTLIVNAAVVLALIVLILVVRQNTAALNAVLERGAESPHAEPSVSDIAIGVGASGGEGPRPYLPAPRAGTRAFDCVGTGREEAAESIARQREVFNRAIETADLDRIESVLAESVVLVTGSDSVTFPLFVTS